MCPPPPPIPPHSLSGDVKKTSKPLENNYVSFVKGDFSVLAHFGLTECSSPTLSLPALGPGASKIIKTAKSKLMLFQETLCFLMCIEILSKMCDHPLCDRKTYKNTH